MRKPSAVKHMTSYGFVAGILLPMMFWWIGMAIGREGIDLSRILRSFAVSAYMAFFIGAVPGTILGFIGGYILHFMTKHIDPHFHINHYRKIRTQALIVVGGFTLLGMSLLVFSVSWLLQVEGLWRPLRDIRWLPTPPIPIYALVAIYSVHRYFLKLRAWGNVGKMKNKAKHAPTNQLEYDDAADDDAFLADESPQQINNTRR
jgi:MFS family permease